MTSSHLVKHLQGRLIYFPPDLVKNANDVQFFTSLNPVNGPRNFLDQNYVKITLQYPSLSYDGHLWLRFRHAMDLISNQHMTN